MSSSASALSPVAAAVYARLNVAELKALAPGGVHDTLPQISDYPVLLVDVEELQQLAGFGAPAGLGLPEVRVRLTAYDQAQQMKRVQQVIGKAMELLLTPPTVDGYASWAIFWDDVTAIRESMIAGVKVQELVADGRLYVERHE